MTFMPLATAASINPLYALHQAPMAVGSLMGTRIALASSAVSKPERMALALVCTVAYVSLLESRPEGWSNPLTKLSRWSAQFTQWKLDGIGTATAASAELASGVTTVASPASG